MGFAVLIVLACAGIGLVRGIAGPETAQPGEFPYFAAIRIDGKHHCGGSLISKRHVLTAAHCVADIVSYGIFDPSRIKIAVNATTVPGGTLLDVQKITHHPSYIPAPTFQADVAVITLQEEIDESEYVRPISLPSPTRPIAVDLELEACGFGSSTKSGPQSSVLKKLKLKTVQNTVCARENYGTPIVIDTPGQSLQTGLFCARADFGKGVCHGDSGGPLAYNKEVLVGTVSGAYAPECNVGSADMYTTVHYYLDYILCELGHAQHCQLVAQPVPIFG